MRSKLAALVVVAMTASARAESPSAASSFDEGLTHFRNKEYPEAAESFFRAYRLAPHADALYNAGLAWELAGRPDSAATAFEMALAKRQLDAAAVADATKRLETLSQSLGRVEVTSPEGSTLRVAPFAVGGPKAVFYFDPGHHSVQVTFEGGHKLRKGVEVAAGATTELVIEAPPSREDKPQAERKPAAPAAAHEDAGTWRTAGWVSIGAAGVATGAAAFLGIQTIRAHDQYVASGRTNTGAKNRTDTYRTWTNVAWATAAITAVGGVGILLFAPDESTSVSLGPTGVWAARRF